MTKKLLCLAVFLLVVAYPLVDEAQGRGFRGPSVIVVDDDARGSPNQDGSSFRPYGLITSAVRRARELRLQYRRSPIIVRVRPGTYRGEYIPFCQHA